MDSKVVIVLCALAVAGVQSRPNRCLCPEDDVEQDLKALWEYLGSNTEPALPGELSPWIKCAKCDKNDSNDLEEAPEEVEDRKKREETEDEDDFSSEYDTDETEHEKDVDAPQENVEMKNEEKRETHLNVNCAADQTRAGIWCVDKAAFML
ncbi:hypothetical protein EVAR_3708_1 [Eumeta japonica]|uniref:Uncharacterized protein n=1 Tax=Eumeta variegata TaxID=151549 RepID=A0A4C1SU84_EUMVA|nr:hypothetical protein EVAR_3708_1 [Eumeta japonica]